MNNERAHGRPMEGKWKVNGMQIEGRNKYRMDAQASELQSAGYMYVHTDSVIRTKSMQSAHHLPEFTLHLNVHNGSSCGSAPR